MKVHFLFESEQESAEREAVMDCELYRGITGQLETSEMVRIPIRTDRRPRNSFMSMQILFNAFFEMAHGDKDIRSRSIFATTSYHDASPYTSGIDSYGSGGQVVRVFPLKTAKAAYITKYRDSLDFIEGVGEGFIRELKQLFGKDSDMDRLGEVSRQIHTIREGSGENCLEQLNKVVNHIKTLCKTDDERSRLEHAIQTGVGAVSQYTVVPATQLTNLGSDEVEVMIFDAAYFYAKAHTQNDEDETISGYDVDDDGIPL